MPKVSVLMAVYETKHDYLRAAVESILNQTFKDFEFLIVDDASKDDNIEKIIQEYNDPRIRYVKNPQNMGISKTRNRLIDLAKGEYLAVMDHDDVSLPQRLEKEVEFLDAHPEVGVVGSWYERFPKHKRRRTFSQNDQIEKELMFFCAVLHPSSMIRRSVLIKNNLRYEEEFSPAEDYALWCRLIGKTKFANIPEVLFKYRVHQSNTSKTQKNKMEEATFKIHEFVQKQHPEILAQSMEHQKISLFGLPLWEKERKGSHAFYKILGCLRFRTA